MTARRTPQPTPTPGPGSAPGPTPVTVTPARGAAGSALTDVVTGLSQQNWAYRRMMTVCDELADASLKGAGIRELTRELARLIGQRVILLDPALGVHAHAGAPGDAAPTGWDPAEPTIGRLLSTLAAERRPLRAPAVPGTVLEHGCLATPVAVGEDRLGYLLVLGRPGTSVPDDADLLTVNYAAMLFALALARERSRTELALRYQGTLVNALVSGHFLDRSDARQKAHALGLADAQRYRVGVARAGADRTPDAPGSLTATTAGQLADRLTRSAAGILAIVRGLDVVMILPEEPAGPGAADLPPPRAAAAPPELLRQLCSDSAAGVAGAQLTCGLSEHLDSPDLAPQGLRQAEHAIDLGTRLGRAGQVISYAELGIYRLLLLVDEMGELSRFAGDILGPLIDYDAGHKLDLVRTLSLYLGRHASLKQTARALRVHANTVAYRVKRIERMTGLDLDDADDRLIAHVAVKIIESQHGTPA